MAVKPAVKKAAQKATYKGDYAGPDVFKGNKALIARWKKAGSPKPGSAAFAKEFPAKAKLLDKPAATPAAKPSAGTPASGAPAAGAPAEDNGPTNPQAPVSDDKGNLVDPNAWQIEQARIATAAADQAEADALDTEDANATLDAEQTAAEAKRQRDLANLTLKQQRDQFNAAKNYDYKKLNNTMAYRGMQRGSAARRAYQDTATQHANVSNSLNNQASNNATTYESAITESGARKKARLAATAKRRLSLAQKAAGTGVYTK